MKSISKQGQRWMILLMLGIIGVAFHYLLKGGMTTSRNRFVLESRQHQYDKQELFTEALKDAEPILSTDDFQEARNKILIKTLPCVLPEGSTNIVALGNRWFEFNLGTNKFMGQAAVGSYSINIQFVTQVR